MHIIDYYNYIATAAYILTVVAALYFYIKGKERSKPFISDGMASILFLVIMAIATFLRLYKLGEIPLGLQQDEASIGYDAYCLANYGIDRNGYHYPIYPITWGCGGGSPLLIYLNMISIKLFGTGILKLRLIPAICGILTVLLFYLTVHLIYRGKDYRNEASLLSALFLAICPWHVILSRWSLDCNIMPFNMMLSVYLFLLGAKKKSTLIYCLSAISFAISMYSYGAATIVVPVFILLISVYCLNNRLITVKQLVISMIAFIVVFLPLLVFYAVNYLGVPEIITPYFSFNRFTAARTGEAFISFDTELRSKLFRNLKSMALALSVGDSNHTLAHYYPGYASLFEFTFPVTIVGLVLSIKELIFGRKLIVEKEGLYSLGNAAFVFIALSSVILDLVIVPDINRMVMMFIPFIYFFVRGAMFVFENSSKLFLVLGAFLLVAGAMFARDYFTDYSTWALSIFMPGYGDAIKEAYGIAGDDRQIISTYDGLSSPFMLALYYNEYDPNKFYTTVEYKDPKAEFRIAKSFGNFVFELPEDVEAPEYEDAVFVVSGADLERFSDLSEYIVDNYGGYNVVRKH